MAPRVKLPLASALTTSLRQLFPASATADFATILTYRLISCQEIHVSGLSRSVKTGSLAVARVSLGPEQVSGKNSVPDAVAEQTDGSPMANHATNLRNGKRPFRLSVICSLSRQLHSLWPLRLPYFSEAPICRDEIPDLDGGCHWANEPG